MRERVPDAIITNGAGNYTDVGPPLLALPRLPDAARADERRDGLRRPGRGRGQGASRPERTVVCFSGDGDFLMCGQELATAVQYELPIVVLVVDNGMYGTIRMHQERQFPGRVVGTDLVNPDFAAYARAFGAHGETVERTEDFPDAFERALGAGVPAVVALQIDPEAITPRTTLSAVRAGNG